MEERITTGGGELEYTLVRKNMKNIRVRVTGDSRVVVSAPCRLPEKRIRQFVAGNEAFILARLREISDKRSLYYPAAYRSGDTFWHLGKETALIVTEADRPLSVFKNGALTLFVPPGADYLYRKALFIRWTKRCAKCVFTARLQAVLPAHLTGHNLRISAKNMLTRWGSINPKRYTISLSVHLLRCEPRLIDYVILHELCHFAHANHSKAFYQELAKYYPNRQPYDKKLKEYGLFDF